VEGLSRNVIRLKQYLERLVLFPLNPKGKDLRNKEKMTSYFMSYEKAKERLSLYKRFVRNPLPVKNDKKQIASIVSVNDVPNYDARATLKSEWLTGKHHFKWRRRNLRLAKKKRRCRL